jgi:hypothetical protein
VFIPAPSGSVAADAGVQLACQLAEQYVRSHPQQPLLVSALFAQHYAREGAAALRQAGEMPQQYYLKGADAGNLLQLQLDSTLVFYLAQLASAMSSCRQMF